jgi:hypothetical protein
MTASAVIELATDTEPLNDGAVAVDIRLDQVLQESTTLSDQDQQSATTVVVMLVGLQVSGEITDSTRQECDLHLWRAGISRAIAVFGNDFSLDCCVQ